jgi:hypothetical protein
MAKVTVTVPSDVLDAASAQVEAGRAPSLSAYLSDALAKKVAADTEERDLVTLLNAWDRELGAPTEADYAWARDVLGE